MLNINRIQPLNKKNTRHTQQLTYKLAMPHKRTRKTSHPTHRVINPFLTCYLIVKIFYLLYRSIRRKDIYFDKQIFNRKT